MKGGDDASFTCGFAWGALRPSETLAAHQSPLWMASPGRIGARAGTPCLRRSQGCVVGSNGTPYQRTNRSIARPAKWRSLRAEPTAGTWLRYRWLALIRIVLLPWNFAGGRRHLICSSDTEEVAFNVNQSCCCETAQEDDDISSAVLILRRSPSTLSFCSKWQLQLELELQPHPHCWVC